MALLQDHPFQSDFTQDWYMVHGRYIYSDRKLLIHRSDDPPALLTCIDNHQSLLMYRQSPAPIIQTTREEKDPKFKKFAQIRALLRKTLLEPYIWNSAAPEIQALEHTLQQYSSLERNMIWNGLVIHGPFNIGLALAKPFLLDVRYGDTFTWSQEKWAWCLQQGGDLMASSIAHETCVSELVRRYGMSDMEVCYLLPQIARHEELMLLTRALTEKAPSEPLDSLAAWVEQQCLASEVETPNQKMSSSRRL